MLNCSSLADVIEKGNDGEPEGLTIIPQPDLNALRSSGEVSVSLRLGRWFISLRQSSQTFFDVATDAVNLLQENRSAKEYYVPFGHDFVLHPGRFVLASTLEWMSFPATIGGYVTGKSTWARRGLIIETAAGIHPGFSGCLTLELANVGEVPIKLKPGMSICQIFTHPVQDGNLLSKSTMTGRRKPYLGVPKNDWVLERLSIVEP
jgi:dCTP deaminase